MIGVVVRELTYLKILAPIMQELSSIGQEYVLYHFDAPRGSKEYNRATLAKMKIAHPDSVSKAKKAKAFSNDKQLFAQLLHDKITKLVSIEIWLWAKTYVSKLKKHNIKTYSILYLTDSLWQKDPACITSMDRVYYSTEYLMEAHHDFASIEYDSNRDRCLGTPAFDPLKESASCENDILVLLPNLRKEHVKISFGSPENMVHIISSLTKAGNLIFKTRKKQWIPNEITQYAKEIIDDGDVMYPPIISDLLKRTSYTVMFYSSGIYECVYAGNYVINIPLPLNRWGWDKKKMNKYFSKNEGNVYQFDGVVKTVEQKDVIAGNFSFKNTDQDRRDVWVKKFIGSVPKNSSKEIAKDIVHG